MTTTSLTVVASIYGVGVRHADFSVRGSTPDVGAMNDRDAQGYWRVIRGGFIYKREHKILDYEWAGESGDQVMAQAWDRAGNAGDWETYTFSVVPNTAADFVAYVDTGGNDTTGDGSEGNPWATGAKAVTEAQAALTTNQVASLIFSDDQTHNFSNSAIIGSDVTSCLIRCVRKGNGTARPVLKFPAGVIGFRAGKRGAFHVDGCDVDGGPHSSDVHPAFDLQRSGGVAADQDPWNVLIKDCNVTNWGRGLYVNWGLTSVDRDTGCNDFIGLQNVTFTGTRWFHVYGMHDTNRTFFRDVTFGTHTAFSNNPFRVFRVGRMYCEDVLFNTGDTGTMRLSVTVGSNDYDAMRECTFNRVRMIGTNSGANSIALQPDAAMSGSGIIRDVRFVDCHLTTAHYAIQADQGGSNAVNTSRIDYLECQSTGNSFLIVGGSGSVSHTHNSIRLRNCGTTRMSYAGGSFLTLFGTAARYAADSLAVEGCWMLWGAGHNDARVFISTSIAVADLANIVAACDYNHLGKTDAQALGWIYAGGSVSRATWNSTYGFDGHSSATLNTTFDLANDGTVPADADFRLTANTGPLAGTGVPLPLGVSIDADGYLRSATTPDAGAYEYGATDTPDDPELPAPSNASRMRRHGLVLGLRLRP